MPFDAQLRLLVLLAIPCLFARTASAQGSDLCATAQPITGLGTFPYVNAGMSTGSEGQSNYDCSHFGETGIFRDVWFNWTAPSTSRFLIQTCELTSLNTKMAIYAGASCPATAALHCNDDYCDSQSALVFDGQAGTTYALQLGSGSSSSGGGNGSFRIEVEPPPVVCGPNVGPDVVVGGFIGVANYTAASGIDAVSMGMTACNIGSSVVNWVDNTNDHPVIRQNLYRYSVVGGAGRFEQLGLSWLKHGFGSAQDSTCCACQPGGNFFHLGIGCSDTYSSGQNGQQPGAGPNFEVNAHTGTFPFPPSNPPYSGAHARRCQVRLADLAPSSPTMRFFGEGHYVAKDDALAGNQNNNASWVEFGVTGGPTDCSFAYSATHYQQSAIRAWAAVDPAVTLTDVQIPADGLVVVGSRVTTIGGGAWHYEYAVYNMNGDRGIGVFSVPLPPGVSVSGIGFHDVAYHDGDGLGLSNWSDADWVVTQSGTALTWACEPQSSNASANAIRWGTLYNFRFDADVPPASGLVSFEPWKVGSPASLSGEAQVPSSSPITAFCGGDGTGTTCPCANPGSPGKGCENSFTTGGARLAGIGAPIVSSDTLRLVATDLPPPAALPVLFFQGDAAVFAGSGSVFGDGLRCAGGNVLRLGARFASGGTVSFGSGVAGDPSIAVQGQVPGGALSTRSYQAWYRNAASYCTSAVFNLSNGLRVVWTP